jgi:glycosyltransferase involved in cell wall biosynthesis
MNGVSIIICCYNSEPRISITLSHISKLEIVPNLLCEVIIVNNNSIDNTKIVAEKIWASFGKPFPLEIVDESTPGLSSARIKGIVTAKYDYIIFCDDDNWLDSKYISIAYNIMESDKKIGAMGGKGEAVSDIDFPDWFDEIKEAYAVGKQCMRTGDITDRKYIWGAGMVTRRELFLKAFPLKYPSLLTDRKGDKLSSGGDSEFSMRLIILGYKLFYDERLVFKHFIPKERLTESYKVHLFEGIKNSQLILNEYVNHINYYFLTPKQKVTYFLKSIIQYTICKIYPNRKCSEQIQVDNIYRISKISLGAVNKNVKLITNFVSSNKYS